MTSPQKEASNNDDPGPSGHRQQSATSKAETWDIVWRLIAIFNEHRRSAGWVVFLQILLLILGLLGLSLTGLGLQYILKAVRPEEMAPAWPFGLAPPDNWSFWLVLGLLSFCILTFALIRGVLNYAYTVEVAKLVQHRIVAPLRDQVFSKMQQLSFRFFDTNASSSIINRVTGDVQMLRMFIDGVLIQSLIMVLSLVVYLVYMLSIHVYLTLACLATTPLLGLLSGWFATRVRPLYRENRELVDRMILCLTESVQGAQVIKSFGREKQINERFADANEVVRDQKQTIFFWVSLFSPSIGLLTQVNLVILLLYGGYLVFQGEISAGDGLFVFAGLLTQFTNQVSNLANVANTAQMSLVAAKRVYEVLDTPVEIEDVPDAIAVPEVRGEVRFDHVSFQFDCGSPILTDLDFRIQPGDCVALVGPLGSGKSTLLSLIPRFYDPDQGRILIDGHDIRDVRLRDLRRHIGLVFQENFLFSSTIAENIAFGHPDARQEDIERAAKIAAAHDFILETENGYETRLGESGINLSGGQRQRLAIARAVLPDPSILLLDDPLAAVDADTEHEILEALENAIKGRTVFIAAHRLSSIVHANVILVLNRGRIVQTGAHSDLRERPGYYKFVADLQLIDDSKERATVSTVGSNAGGKS